MVSYYMRSFIHIEIRDDAQRDYRITITLPIQYFTMLFLTILIDSNDCILMSQLRCLKNAYNLEFIAFINDEFILTEFAMIRD